jgi:hypothetical protein
VGSVGLAQGRGRNHNDIVGVSANKKDEEVSVAPRYELLFADAEEESASQVLGVANVDLSL